MFTLPIINIPREVDSSILSVNSHAYPSISHPYPEDGWRIDDLTQ